jgi:hypothetical protein
LTGYFKIGHRTISAGDTNTLVNGIVDPNQTIDRDNSGMLGLDANLTWMASSKLLVQLALSRDFGTGGLGEAVETDSANLIGNYSFNAHWSAMANLGYTERDTSNFPRENELLTGGLRLMYVLNTYWRFSAGYTYTDNDSSRASSSYDNNSLDLTAILRY